MKNTYWIADENGVKACVTGAANRDFWTRVHGYTETSEPTGLEFQWVRNVDHGGRGVMNHEALLLHAGLGWVASDPEPVPGMPDQTAETAPPRMAAPTTATGGTEQE
jgi:hypothetical protein